MPRIIRSARSEQDVYEIALHIAKDNPDAALRWIDRVNDALTMLAQFPEAGRARTEIAPRVRSLPVSSYILFYRPMSDGIDLARVLHGARDLRRLFRTKSS